MLGSIFASRASRAQATRSARANALNTASMWWWLDRPYSTLTCTLARAPDAKPSKKSCTSSVCRSPTFRHLDLQIDHRVRPAAQVDRGDRERLVHRHDEVAGAIDPFPIAERLQHRLAERDADVLDGVMLIDVEIALRLQREIEAAVAREQLQHVIEEADAGADVVPALPVDRQPPLDLRLRRTSIERRGSRFIAPASPPRPIRALRCAALVCSSIPAVIRMHPGVAGSFDRSRT